MPRSVGKTGGILVLIVLVFLCALYACQSQHTAVQMQPGGGEITLEGALTKILVEYNIKDNAFYIESDNEIPFAGCILSASRLQSQVVVTALYSLPVETNAEFFYFRLSEFIVDDVELSAYRESIHEVFTVDRYNGTVKAQFGRQGAARESPGQDGDSG